MPVLAALPVMADNAARSNEEKHRQDIIDNTKVIFEGSDSDNVECDSVRNLMTDFYYNQFRHSQDPEIPYFMFMSKSANYTMGIGGVVKMRGWFDWGNTMPYNGFSPFSIPIPADETDRKKLKATPAGCAVYLTLLGRNTPIGRIQGYLEGNFNGYNHVGFKLSRAYVTVNDWTVGYAKSTFCDPAATPPTVDGAGPNAVSSKTNVLVRYMHTFKNRHWTLAGSVEIPDMAIADDGVNTKKCSAWFPDLCTFGQYQWDGGASHVRLSGIFRLLPYRDLLKSKNYNLSGWGAQLSSVVRISYPLTVYAQVNTGRGNGSYLEDLSIGATDLISDPGTPGRLYAPLSMGYTIGAKYYFSDNVFSAFTAGQMRFYCKSGAPEDMYRYGNYGAVNVFWNITPRIQTGAEYLIGKRKNIDGADATSNRVTAFFMLNF